MEIAESQIVRAVVGTSKNVLVGIIALNAVRGWMKMSRYIDADALKNSIDEHVYLVHHGFNETEYGCTQYGIHQIIDEAPTIDAEPQWIPCSERLPENMEPVNITWVNRDPGPYYMHIKDKPFTATGIYFKGQWYWWSSTCADMLCEYGHTWIDSVDDGIEITAWMPLPKPYEVEK
jgi:hypothetical protein